MADCQAKILGSVSVRVVGTLGERTVRPDFKVPNLPSPLGESVTCGGLLAQTVTMSLLQRSADGAVTVLAEKPFTRSDADDKKDLEAKVNDTYRYFTLPTPLSEADASAQAFGVRFTFTAAADPAWLSPDSTPPSPQTRDYTAWLNDGTTMPRRHPISAKTAARLARASHPGKSWRIVLTRNTRRAQDTPDGARGSSVSSGPFGVTTYSARWGKNAAPLQKAFLLVQEYTTVLGQARWYLYEPNMTSPRAATWTDRYLPGDDGSVITLAFLLRPSTA